MPVGSLRRRWQFGEWRRMRNAAQVQQSGMSLSKCLMVYVIEREGVEPGGGSGYYSGSAAKACTSRAVKKW